MMKKLKSSNILKLICNNIKKRISLKILNYNKYCQNRLGISINDYIEYSKQIIIQIIINANKLKKGKNFFINIKENKSLYDIYFDGKYAKDTRNYIEQGEKIPKIKIILENGIKSIDNLFYECQCIKEIKFIKFNRRDFTDMSYLFYSCENLENLDITELKTNNVTNMRSIFFNCISLKELDLSNINTENVDNMSYMFCGCISLENLNLTNFKTDKVKYMNDMFSGCSSLKKLDLSHFITKNVENMNCMFNGCSSLIDLNIANFNTKKISHTYLMFGNCSEELKEKVKEQNIKIIENDENELLNESVHSEDY